VRKKREQNHSVRSEIKTLLKRVSLIASQDLEKAKQEARLTVSKLDKAARRSIIPKGHADRKKADLAVLLAKSARK